MGSIVWENLGRLHSSSAAEAGWQMEEHPIRSEKNKMGSLFWFLISFKLVVKLMMFSKLACFLSVFYYFSCSALSSHKFCT